MNIHNEIQINQLPSIDTINDSDTFVVDVKGITYKILGHALIDYIKENQEVLKKYAEKKQIGVANGITPLDSNSKIDGNYIRYGTTQGTAFEGSDGLKLKEELLYHTLDASNPHNVTKQQLGIEKVENKSADDILNELSKKNVETALGFVPEEKGSYERSVGYVDKKISDLINGAPEYADTLEELNKLVSDNKDLLDILTDAISKKATKSELDSHTGNGAVHVTQTDKSNIEVSLSHAKSDHARADATKTEKSNVNGNVKINENQVEVYSHPLSGVNPGTYRQIKVDEKGHVVDGNNTTLPVKLGGTGAVTAEEALLNFGITSTADELNVLDGATVNAAEINTLKGVTSSVQEQLNNKSPLQHGNHVPDMNGDTIDKVLMSDGADSKWRKPTIEDVTEWCGYRPGTGSNIITAVKGSAETEYRTGNVEITKESIGIPKVENTSDKEKSVYSAGRLTTKRKIILGGLDEANTIWDGSEDLILDNYGYTASQYLNRKGEKDNTQYYRVAIAEDPKQSFKDKSMILLLTGGCLGSKWGILKADFRVDDLNSTEDKYVYSRASCTWLVRHGYELDQILIKGYRSKESNYADLYVKSIIPYEGFHCRVLMSGSRAAIGREWVLDNDAPRDNPDIREYNYTFESTDVGMVSYAHKLRNPRQINGTNFDGSSSVVTNSWGEKRNITLSGAVNGEVSTDGSGDIVLNTVPGEMKHVGNINYIAYPEGGYYITTPSAESSNLSKTGFLKITLPNSWTNTMIGFCVSIYNYEQNGYVKYFISGYNYAPDSMWHSTCAYSIGNNTNLERHNYTVHFGHDGNKCAIYIGCSDTIWDFPQISISDITVGYSGYDDKSWETNWQISFTSTLGTISSTIENPSVSQKSESTEKIISASGKEYKIDVVSESQFNSLEIKDPNTIYYLI